MAKTLVIPPDRRLKPDLPVRQFSITEYRSMIETGVLTPSDRVELINGWIVPKVPQNEPHVAVIEFLILWLAKHLDDKRYSLRSQLPLTLDGDCEPEPDFAIVLAKKDRSRGRHPSGAETLLVIEVADSSPNQDRGDKLEMYAANQIPEYWIVNLIDREVEVHTKPVSGRKPAYHERSLYLLPNDQVPFAFGNARQELPVIMLFGIEEN